MASNEKKSPGSEDSLKEDEVKKKDAGFLKNYGRIFTFADATSWALIVVGCSAAAGSGVALPLMNLVFGKQVTTFNNFALGTVTPADFRSEVNRYTLFFVYIFIGRFVLNYLWTVCLSISAIRITKAMRIRTLQSALRQPISYFDVTKASSTTVLVTTNSNLVNNGINEKIGLIVQGFSTLICAFAVAFSVQWKLTLITIAVVPSIVVIVGACIAFDTKVEAKILPLYSKASMLAEEVFGTMKTVKSFWAMPAFEAKFQRLLTLAKREGYMRSPIYGVLFSTEYFCIFSGYALAFWQGIRRFASGEITQPGQVVTVIFAVVLAATSLSTIGPQFLYISKAAGASVQLFEIIERTSEVDPFSEDGAKPDSCVGDIEVEDVRFAYPARPDVEVLKGMSLKIPANRTTALVGPSGCGKSTIIGLLERWYEPLSGTVKLDGNHVSDLNLRYLRTNIRLVGQEPVLFRGSVFRNVANGLEGTPQADLSDEDKMKLVVQACKDAYAHDFVEQLPNGYETYLSERAASLSGGQKQRIAIARAIISQPQVLLLDEATSGLDTSSEKIVQEALNRVAENRTVIVIAHRLSTIRGADNIAVLQDGRVIEQGTHTELIAQDGHYATLVKSQDLGQQGDAEDLQQTMDKPGGQQMRKALSRRDTQGSGIRGDDVKGADHEGFHYSLPGAVWVSIKDQRKLWPWIGAMIIPCVLAGLTFPAQGIVFARVLGAFQLPPAQAVERGDFFSLMFFIIALGNFVCYFIIGWVSNYVAQWLTFNFRSRLFRDILSQDMEFFDNPENTTGALASRLTEYPTNLQDLLGFNLMLLIIISVNLVSSSVLAIIVGWKLGLVVVFGGLPPLVFSGYLRVRLERKLENDTSKRFSDSAGLAGEAVGEMRTISSFTLEKHVLESYTNLLSGIETTNLGALVWTMFWYSLSQSIVLLILALGFWYGSRLMSYGEYSPNQFFIIFIAVIFAGEAGAQFFGYTTSAGITKAQGAANYIFWIRSLKPQVLEDLSKPAPPGNHDDPEPLNVNLNQLEFAYPLRPNNPVIKELDVKIPSGGFTAFVGASGSGKSTLIALLERFYDPTGGKITLSTPSAQEERALPDLDPRKYRETVGLVQQEPVLYSGSVRENIAVGLARPVEKHRDEETKEIEIDVSEADIEEACRGANIYDFITSLPQSFNTQVGAKGTQLSGGQKQRIAIARALIRKPKLLLLDEATSALDSESEKIVQDAIDSAREGRTTVAIAHRLSTIKHADTIVVINRGKIAEIGSHDKLIEKRGIYWDMCKAQALDK